MRNIKDQRTNDAIPKVLAFINPPYCDTAKALIFQNINNKRRGEMGDTRSPD